MEIELMERGLRRIRSASNRLCNVTLESNKPCRNPSCKNIKMPAKPMPAKAIINLPGCLVNNSQERGIPRDRQIELIKIAADLEIKLNQPEDEQRSKDESKMDYEK
jgi:hypothetical protein